MKSKSLEKNSFSLYGRTFLITIFAVFLIISSFPITSRSVGETRSEAPPAITTFYLRGQSQLSTDNPSSGTPQVISVPRSTPLEPWPSIGEWSYTVPEFRAVVDGTVSYSYTLRNFGVLPVAQVKLNFILKGSGNVIKEETVTHNALASGRTRTFSASTDISATYILQNAKLSLEIRTNTTSNNVQFLYDSWRYASSLEVNYAEANFPPVANAGNDMSLREGEVADLRGTGSDVDGYITQYEWDFEGDGVYDWSSALGGSTSHRYTVPGTYLASLRVTDDDGLTDVDTATITVAENKKPSVVISTPTGGQVVNSTVTISGTASDDDGEVESVWIRFDDGIWHRAVGTDNWVLNWDTTLETNDVHVIFAKSNDSLEESAMKSVQVTVDNTGVNPRPTCSILSISPNPAFKLDEIEFMGEGNDDGTIVVWRWSSSIEGEISDQQNFSTNSLNVGNHTIYLQVKDDNGSWSNSDSRLLIIKEFSRPKQITAHSSSDIESDTIFDAYDVFWCAWSSYRDGNRNIYLKSSVDGVEWGTPIQVTDEVSSEKEPSLIQLNNLTYVIAYSSDISGNYDIYLKYSHWGGYWSDPVRVTSDSDDEMQPCLYQRPDGRIFLAYSVDKPSPVGTSIVLRNGNNIFSFSPPVTATTGLSYNYYPALTEAPDGNLSVVFSSDRTGNFEIWQTTYLNMANFSTPRRITYSVRDNFFPCVFEDVSSMYRVVYSDDTDTLYLTDSMDLVEFSPSAEIPTEFTDNNDPCIFQDADGSFWVTWNSADSGNDDIYALSFSGNSPPHPIISSPVDGQNYFTSDTISFDGTSSYDPNGNEELDSFTWRSDLSGTLSTQQSFTRILEAGMHNITLTVSDIHGAESTAKVRITVTSTPNQSPTANATVSKETAKVNEELTFSGSDSSDPDGDTLSYRWDFDRDGTWDDLNETAVHAYNASGNYVVTLMVEDTSGANDTDTLTITINENEPPNADAGEDQLVNVNTTVNFDATDSDDPDDETLYYAWDFDGDGVTDSQSAKPTHMFSERGEYTVNLTVSDPYGANDTDSVVITVNKPPVAVIEGENEGYIGEVMSFSALASHDDDGDELEYQWDFDSDGEVDGAEAEMEHTYEEAGEYIVVLWVQDGRDGTDSAEMEVTVILRNTAPMAEAGEDIYGNAGEEVRFDGTDSYDPDDDTNGNGQIDEEEGEINNLTYLWEVEEGRTETGSTPTYIYEEAGEYLVTLRVGDPEGSISNDTLTVFINTAPIAAISLMNVADMNEGDEVTLSASESTDDDGDVLTYSWDFDDSDGITEEATGEEVKHTYDVAGSYIVTLKVDDGNGGNDTETLTVEIKEGENEIILDEPTIEITSPTDNKKLAYGKNSITVECSAEGEYIERVEITLYKGDTEVETQEITEDFEEISVTFSLKAKTAHEIFARVVNDDYPEYSAYDSVNISFLNKPAEKDEPETGGGKIIPFLPEGKLAQYGGIGVIGIVILLAGYFLVIRRRKRGKTAGELEVAEEIEEVEDDELEEVELAEVVAEEPGEDISLEKIIKPVSQPILCPKCSVTFNVDDYGVRPLPMKCSNCGASGKINTPVPPLLKERIENALRKKVEAKDPAKAAGKKVAPGPIIVGRESPAAGITEDALKGGVRIRCPKCDKGFMTTTRKEITCPHCGAKGDVPKKEFEKLKRRQQAQVKRLPAAKESKEPVKKVSKKDLISKLTSSADKVECPKCTASFFVEPDAKKIKCPSCGVKGKMG